MLELAQEPESAESQIVDSFFLALMDGKGERAASALRQLRDLNGFSAVVKCVATLLTSPALLEGVCDRRLVLKKRTKGRSKKPPVECELDVLELGETKAFFGFVASGNTHQAGMALNNLDDLHGIQLKLFADLFDNSPELPEVFQWWFRFEAKSRGKPVNRLRSSATTSGWKRVLTDAFSKNAGKKEAGIHDVMVRTKTPRSTVMDWMDRLDIPAKK